MSAVTHIRNLDLDAIPARAVSRLLVEVATDGLGQSINVPVLVARGPRPGPVVGITAVVHGNELIGIAVIHRLFETLPGQILAGTVVGVVVVNVPGLHAQQREFNDGTDLNDIFPGKANGNVSEIYVHRLLERVIGHFDYLLDLHTASFGRVNSLYVRADMTDPVTAQLAYLQNPQIILHNAPSDGTLRGEAMARGIPAITVEIADPQRFQPRYIRTALAGVNGVLAHLEVIKRRPPKAGPPPVLCGRASWLYTDRGGLLDVTAKLVDTVKKGEVVARLVDAFGDLRTEYTAPRDGIVIGKSVNPVGQTGARILHLGVVADRSAASFVERELLGPAESRR